MKRAFRLRRRTSIAWILSVAASLGCKGGPASTEAAPPPSTPATPSSQSPLGASRSAASPAAAGPSPSAEPGTAVARWNFDADVVESPPKGFSFGRTGSGREGKWAVRADPGAPSPHNVLAQLDADPTDYRFPVAVANEPSLLDFRLSARCKPVSGGVDQACGLVFRFRDKDNYYVTRANALEDNVRLYHVVKGERGQFAGWDGKVSTGAWHSLQVDAKGDHFEVHWDDKKIIDAHDSTFSEAGKVGVWTKADSVTYYDDLNVSPLY